MHNFAVFGIPIIVFHVYVVVVVAAVVVNDTILDRLDKILMHLSMFSPRGGGGGGGADVGHLIKLVLPRVGI